MRRAHRNDLENVLPLILAGLFYTLTNPAAFVAINVYRTAALARILHSIVYAVVVLPQPSRAIAFFIPLAATIYMALQTCLYFL